MYDSIIIGCGISGLYLGNKLSSIGHKIILFDQRERIGGRIISIKDINNNTYDVGAVKIPSDQIRINRLIKKLNLNNNKMLINNNFKYNNHSKSYYKNNLINLFDKIKNKDIKTNSKSVLQLSEELFDNNFSEKLVNMSGYNGNFEKLNFNGFIKYTGDINRKYYILKDGLTQICNKLVENEKLDIHLKSKLVSYTYDYNKKIFNIKIERNNKIQHFKSYNLILAIPKKNLKKIFCNNKFNEINLVKNTNISEQKYILPLLDTVKTNNYMRIFATYPKINNKIWFKNLGDIHTSGFLRKASPYNSDTGIMQISYTDNRYADIWKNILLDNKKSILHQNNIYNIIHKKLSKLYKKKIPNPLQYSCHYWSHGTHYWLPNVNINDVHNNLIKPFDYRLYICGEAYSNYQSWMEGALETADKVYQNILKKDNRYINKISTKRLHKYYSLKDVEKHNTKNDAWLIYNNNVYNVTSFIHKHPGSNAILKGIGKDSTDLFDNVGHSNNARYMMKKYYIGKYKKI